MGAQNSTLSADMYLKLANMRMHRHIDSETGAFVGLGAHIQSPWLAKTEKVRSRSETHMIRSNGVGYTDGGSFYFYLRDKRFTF